MKRKVEVLQTKINICIYCGENLTLFNCENQNVSSLSVKTFKKEHLKVHKVLRHKKLPVKVYGQLYNAAKNCMTTLRVLNKL